MTVDDVWRPDPHAKPRVGITVGDPSGIGPEVTEQAVQDPRVQAVCVTKLYGPVDARAREAFVPGVGSAAGGRAAYEAVCEATADALAGRVDAVVTAPINKATWAQAGLPWRGHTDLLAHLTGSHDVAMMFHAERLRVVLATVHIPLSEVPSHLTRARVISTIRLAHRELPRFGIARPRLALAGLNPHAGEAGLMGREEGAVLEPAVAVCAQEGIDVSGPWPGDTVFVRAAEGAYDAVIACYHDQGLIPIKMIAFGQAVNVTLGLPIVRTSVDHGTAYAIAGRGVADPSSMIEAVRLAAQLVVARRGNAA